MIPENERQSNRDLIDMAADEVGSLNAVARETGISRRRLDYLRKGERPLKDGERWALLLLIARQL